VNFFLLTQTDEEKNKNKANEEYKMILSSNVSSGTYNLLEYTYLLNYINEGQTIINISWFIELINKLKNNDMNKIIINLYPNIYKTIDDNQIDSNIKNLINNMKLDKKDHIKIFLNFCQMLN
jgi:hypothetical protein